MFCLCDKIGSFKKYCEASKNATIHETKQTVNISNSKVKNWYSPLLRGNSIAYSL